MTRFAYWILWAAEKDFDQSLSVALVNFKLPYFIACINGKELGDTDGYQRDGYKGYKELDGK